MSASCRHLNGCSSLKGSEMKFRKFAVDSSKFNLIDKVLNSSHGNNFRTNQTGIPDMCVMEAASWVTGRKAKTDHPECTDGHLTAFCISMNDALGDRVFRDAKTYQLVTADDLRAKYLKPLIPAIINTRLIVHYVSPEEKAQGYQPGSAIDYPRSERTALLLTQLQHTQHSWFDDVTNKYDLETVERVYQDRTDLIRAAAASMKADIHAYRVEKGWSRARSTPPAQTDAAACEIVYAGALHEEVIS